jgi:peptide/nickel transport system substrate-binding protein
VFRRFVISCIALLLAVPAVARTRPHYGGTLRVETEGDPWQRPGGIARRLVYDGLTRIDANGSVQPALATGWEADSGDHRWEFHLRSGVHFHDSSALTSAAVVASLNLSCNGNCPWSAVHAVGQSVVFTGDSPMPNLPALLAADDFLIAFIGSAEGAAQQPNVGTGSFEVASSANGVLSLKANEASWQGRPFADTIELRTHRSVHDQWLDLSLGHADIVEVPAAMIRQAQQQKMSLFVSGPAELLALQVASSGPLANPQLRAALAASIDRAPLANVIFQKQGEAAAGVLPQSLSGYSFLFATDRDLNKANALRGGVTAPSLTLAADPDGVMQLAAQRIALNLREAGFNAVVATTPASQHPDLTLRRIPLQGGSPSAVLDAVLRSCGETQLGTDSNPSALYKAERTFLDQHTLVPLVNLPHAFAAGDRVRDFHLNADGTPDLADTSLEDAP